MAAGNAIPIPVKNQLRRIYFAFIDRTTSLPVSGGLTGLAATISKDGGNYAATTNTPVEIQSSGTGYVELTATESNCSAFIVKITCTDLEAVCRESPFISENFDLSHPTDHWRDATVVRLEQGLMHVIGDFCNQGQRRYSDGQVVFYDHDGTEVYRSTYSSITDADLQTYEKRGRISP